MEKLILLNYLQQVNAQELKDFIIEMVKDMPDENFISGHSNGYNDGNGVLKDIYVNGLMFDCRTGEPTETILINTETSECELFDSIDTAKERLKNENEDSCFLAPCEEVEEGAELELWSNATKGSSFGFVAEVLKSDLTWDDFRMTTDEPIKYKHV